MICPASISRWRGSTLFARGLARRFGGGVVARAIGDDEILRDLADQLRLLLVEIDRDAARAAALSHPPRWCRESRSRSARSITVTISCVDALPRVFREVENLIDRFGRQPHVVDRG